MSATMTLNGAGINFNESWAINSIKYDGYDMQNKKFHMTRI